MVKGYTHMTQTEVDLARTWRHEGKSLGEVAALLGRGKETVRKNSTPRMAKIVRNRKRTMKALLVPGT